MTSPENTRSCSGTSDFISGPKINLPPSGTTTHGRKISILEELVLKKEEVY